VTAIARSILSHDESQIEKLVALCQRMLDDYLARLGKRM
jgi:hypothetical protein